MLLMVNSEALLRSVYAADFAMILYKKALESIHNAFHHYQTTKLHGIRDQDRLALAKLFQKIS